MVGGASIVAPDRTTVSCGRHGFLRAACVSPHRTSALDDRRPGELRVALDEDGRRNAFCDQCEAYTGSHGGEWNDQTGASTGIRLLRPACFEELKTFNTVKDWT